MLIEETLILDRSLVTPNKYGNSYNNSCGNFNKMPSDFENSVKEFMISQKNFNALLEEKFLKVDDLARNVDRLSLDVDSLKLRSTPPKHDINESLKAMRISIDECKERTARMRAKKDCFVKACSSCFGENKDEDLKVIDVSPIKIIGIGRTCFNKGIFGGTHPSGSFLAPINGNSHGFERLIDIMLRGNRSKL